MINLQIQSACLSFHCFFQDDAMLDDLASLIFTVAGHHKSEGGYIDAHLHQFNVLRLRTKEECTKALENFSQCINPDLKLNHYKIEEEAEAQYKKQTVNDCYSSHEFFMDNEDSDVISSYEIKLKDFIDNNINHKISFQYDFGARYEYSIKPAKIIKKYFKKDLSEKFCGVYKLKGFYMEDSYSDVYVDFHEKTKKYIMKSLRLHNKLFKSFVFIE